jgi:transcription elongation factor Elf1
MITNRRDAMEKKKMKCPNCGRRAFDISRLPKEEVEVTLKCPQCGKFVSVPCNEKSELKVS